MMAFGLTFAGTASAAGLSQDLRRSARALGPQASLHVTDARGTSVVSVRANVPRAPASTAKLLTAAAALQDLGAATRLQTSVTTTSTIDTAGLLRGNLIVRGGGDPLFGTPPFTSTTALADAVVGAGIRRIEGSVLGDGTLFDGLRGRLGVAFDPEVGGALGGLTFHRGRQAADGPVQPDPDRAAAAAFDDALEARGVVITGRPQAALTPGTGQPIASAASPDVRTMLGLMLRTSDNFIAEMLAKRIAVAQAPPGTTAAGATRIAGLAQRATGRMVTLIDGSGLDPRSRVTARQLVIILRRLAAAGLDRELPTGGQGTLTDRLTTAPAAGRCRMKTGTLPDHDVSALAGRCRTLRGRTLYFALLTRGDIATMRRVQDRLVQIIAADRRSSRRR